MDSIMQQGDYQQTISNIREQIERVIVGQKEVVDHMLLCIFAGGHALLEGIPGLGKTMLVRTVADTLDLSFSRIQFTPDLMPSDITGTYIVHFGDRGETSREFQKGPLFGHLVLADEINRATPKTQSALLEAMQEKTITVGTSTYQLPAPFFVLATQNPLEQEGTYPLPEAQLDRFLFKILMDYPNREELMEIVRRTTAADAPQVKHAATADDVIQVQQMAKQVLLSDEVLGYAADGMMKTHPEQLESPETVKKYVRYGSGPRGIQAIISTAKVRALTEGRLHVTREDIQTVFISALRHRAVLNFEGEASGVKMDDILQEILQSID